MATTEIAHQSPDTTIPRWFAAQWALCLIKVRYAGVPRIGGSSYVLPRHDHWSYYAVHQGQLRVKSFGYDLVVPAGHAVVLPPYRQAERQSVDPRQPVVVTEVGFHIEVFGDAGNPLVRIGLPASVNQADELGFADWCTRLERCFQKFKPVSHFNGLQAAGWFGLLLLAYLKDGFSSHAFKPAKTGPVPTWVQALADDLSQRSKRYQQTPRSLHKLSGFSRSHVNASFKKYLGMTPRQYLHRRRLALAVQFLTSNPEMSFGEVATACGYSTQPMFNRHFLRFTGQTPGQFRRAHHKTP
jgi:AraC-like DNA-binding protein